MAGISSLITLGVGTPAEVADLIWFGLSPSTAPVVTRTRSSFLDDLSDVLATGGITRPIFKIHLPAAAADAAVLLTPMGGQPSLQTMAAGPLGPCVVVRPTVRITCRDRDYAVARRVAHIAFRLTDGFRAETVNGIPYLWMVATSSPRMMGTDQNARSLVGFDLEIWKQRNIPAFGTGTFAETAFAAVFSE